LKAIFMAVQLAGHLAGHHVDAGVKIFAAFLGPDHHAIGKHGHFRRLLGHAGVAGDREMHVRLFHQVFEVADGAGELGFGVLANRGRDVQIATVDQEFHGGSIQPVVPQPVLLPQ